MLNLHVTDIRLEKLEAKATWGKNSREGEIELAVCKTGKLGTGRGEGKGMVWEGGFTSCLDTVASLC